MTSRASRHASGIAVLGLAGLLLRAVAAQAHGDTLFIGSSAKNGGQLVVQHEFPAAVAVTESFAGGGQVLYAALQPSPDLLATDSAGESMYVLATGTEVILRIVAIDPEVSVRMAPAEGGTPLLLGTLGDVATIGTTPTLHTHPEWRLTLPEGVHAARHVVIRLEAPGSAYAVSPDYEFILSNGPAPSPTPVPTSTPKPLQTSTPGPAPTGGPVLGPVTTRPRAVGDQAIFFFDTRERFTTFLNLRNESARPLSVRMVFHGADLEISRLETFDLPASAGRTIDVGERVAAGLPRQAGLVSMTAIDESGRSLVRRALSGSFTVANLDTSSAWGGPALARVAVQSGGADAGRLALVDDVIDGDTVRLQSLRPPSLLLSTFYDPASLRPAALGGNQVIATAFADALVDGGLLRLVAVPTTFMVETTRGDGQALGSSAWPVDGVVVSDLESIGGEGVRGQAGSMSFVAPGTSTASRAIWFTEALGTFGTGYLLPPPGS